MSGRRIKNRGFTLVEVICSLLIFTLVLASIFKLKIHIFKMEDRCKTIEEYSCFLSGLKYNILKNFTYDEIKVLQKENKLNIPKENINVNLLCDENIKDIFQLERCYEYPYVLVEVEDYKKDDVFKVKLNLYFMVNGNKQNMNVEFLKGNY